MKAIVYARVSTEEQASSGYSIQDQIDQGKQKAIELGVDLDDILVFEDRGVSGEVLNRPALMDAIASIEADVKYFIIKDPDRLSRDSFNMLYLTKEIEDTGVTLLYTNYDRQTTPDGNLMYNIRGAIAEFEKEMIKRRTMAGKMKKAQQHLLTHWPGIYGYHYDKPTQTVTVNEEQANIIKFMFEWGKEHGVFTIVNKLNDMGVISPRGSIWRNSTVRRILHNETYKTGIVYIRRYSTEGTHLNKYKEENKKIKRKIRPEDEWIDIRVPIIIDASTFDTVQRRIENANRIRTASNTQTKYLLSGMIRCGQCGHSWHGHGGKYYVCTSKSPGVVGKPKCMSHFTSKDKLEDSIWNMIKEWILDHNTFDTYMNAAVTFTKSSNVEEVKLLRKQMDGAIQEREDILDLIKQRAVRASDVSVRLRQITERIEHIEKQLEELTDGEEETAVDREPLLLMTQKYKDHIDELSFDKKYEIVHTIVRRIIIHSDISRIIVQTFMKKL